MKKVIVLSFIAIVSFSSCDKEEETIPSWKFQFIAVNDGDGDISTITLNTSISYPNEEETILQGTIKSKSKADEAHLKQFDSLKITSNIDVYPGCAISARIGIARKVFDNEGVFLAEKFKFYNVFDTIRLLQDTAIVVTWPADSMLFRAD